MNNKKVQQCIVNVDGGLELLQASGFELIFDESSPEPQAAAPSHVSDHVPSTKAAQAQPDSQADALLSEVSRTCKRSALSFATCSQMSHGAIISRHTKCPKSASWTANVQPLKSNRGARQTTLCTEKEKVCPEMRQQHCDNSYSYTIQTLTAMHAMQSKGAAPAAECEAVGHLWFPEEAELWLLQAALQLLRPLTPLPFSKTSTGRKWHDLLSYNEKST